MKSADGGGESFKLMEKGTMSVNKVDVPPECVMRSQDMKVGCKLAHTPPFRGGIVGVIHRGPFQEVIAEDCTQFRLRVFHG